MRRVYHLAPADAVIVEDGEYIAVPLLLAPGGPSRDEIERRVAADRPKLAAAVEAVFAERRRRASAATRERLRARHLARQRDRIAAAKTAAKTAALVKQTTPQPIKSRTVRDLNIPTQPPPPYVYRIGYVHLNTE